jgi:hypothetical protein
MAEDPNDQHEEHANDGRGAPWRADDEPTIETARSLGSSSVPEDLAEQPVERDVVLLCDSPGSVCDEDGIFQPPLAE